MMTAERILALLNQRASEFKQRADAKVASIGFVSDEEETKEQKKIRASAQADWETWRALSDVIAEIEAA
jgi:hypothetical protein